MISACGSVTHEDQVRAQQKRMRSIAFFERVMESLSGFRDSLMSGSFNLPVLDRKGADVLKYICEEVCV